MSTLYTLAADMKAFKAIAAAAFAGYELKVEQFKPENPSEVPTEKSPSGYFPCLETKNGCISESNAIARYIARACPEANLYGKSFFEQAQVDSIVDWSLVNLEVPSLLLTLPIFGQSKPNFQVNKKATDDFNNGLEKLEADLLLKTFLVGDSLTLADIVVASILYYPYKLLMDAGFRRKYPNVCRHYSLISALPAFQATVGPIVPCVTAIKFKDLMKAAGGKKKGAPKQKKQKKQQPKKQKAAPKPKKADPLKVALKALPRPKMAIDEWKRQYSNAKGDRYKSMDWLWANIDLENYSFWLQDFKYQEENTVDFMTNNKAKGFIQRCDGIVKYGFGIIQILDTKEAKGHYTMRGVFMLVGQSVGIVELANPEYETFSWTKLDPTSDADKKKIADYFCSDMNCEVEPGVMADDWAVFK